MANFPTLKARSEQVGFSISNVMYRGYKVSSELEAMMDEKITTRHSHVAAEIRHGTVSAAE